MIMKNQRFDNSTIKFYGSGKCEVKTVEIYYYDKNGEKQSCSGSQYFDASAKYADGHGELKDKGTIVIGKENSETANDFVPLSVKYIKIKVTCDGVEDPVYVTIKQYPLEYIQGIAGWYSTKSIDGWIDWQTDQAAHSDWKASSDNNFKAKVKIGEEIYEYNDKRYGNRREGYYYAATKGSRASDGQHNNQMYVVQITSTQQGSNYKIGHVKNTSYSTENVVSPAFMLASQLGTVTAHSTGESASQHCNDYVEVSKDGKVYDDWRLPTPAEIGVITKYQYDESQNVITEVLKGRYYWALNHQKIETRKENSYTGARCVRDLSPDEVKELENKNE